MKKIKKSTKTTRKSVRSGKRGGSIGGALRKCGVCQKNGHNRRSHEPGGKLAK
jgi:hypothetical protein